MESRTTVGLIFFLFYRYMNFKLVKPNSESHTDLLLEFSQQHLF